MNRVKSMVVVGAILEKDNKFMLCQQAEYKGEDAFKWGIPAGKWDNNENILEGVCREVKEETGYDFTPEALLGFYSRKREFPDITINILRVIFRGTISGEPSNLAHDIIEAKWFDFDEIMKMGEDTIRTPEIRTMLQNYNGGQSIPLEFLSIYDEK